MLLTVLTGSCSKKRRIDPTLKQQPELKPVPLSDNRYLFSYRDRYGWAKKVSLVGNFHWQGKPVTSVEMVDHNQDGVFRYALHLDPGDYYYKFLINDTLLVNPPLSQTPALQREMYSAGRLFVPNPDLPFVQSISPAHESTVTNLETITIKMGGNHDLLGKDSLRALLNDDSLDISYNPDTAVASARPENPNPGSYTLQIYGQNQDGSDVLYHKSSFFYRDKPVQVPAPVFTAHTAYRVLVPAFGNEEKPGTGALQDLIDKLDYLNDGEPGGNDLGIQILILYNLMPAADPYHHRILDYKKIAAHIGYRRLLNRLGEACKKRGIKLIMHYNAAYLSNKHTFFQDAYDNPASKRASMFFFENDQGTRYRTFGNDPAQPRLDLNDDYASMYFVNDIWEWIKSGLTGLYFENAALLSRKWVEKLHDSIYQYRNNIALVGATRGTPDFLVQLMYNKFNAVAATELGNQFIMAAAGNNPRHLNTKLTNITAAMPSNARLLIHATHSRNLRPATYLGSTNRIAHYLGLLLTSGGIPVLNWGDELGLPSVKPPFQDKPPRMPWQEARAQTRHPDSLYWLTKRLIRLRETYPELNSEWHQGKPVLHWENNPEAGAGYAAFIRHTKRNRFFAGILVYNTNLETVSPEFRADTLAAGQYTGRLVSRDSSQPVQGEVQEGLVQDLELAVDGQPFLLFRFDRQ